MPSSLEFLLHLTDQELWIALVVSTAFFAASLAGLSLCFSPMVVELQRDPPPDAHYIRWQSDDETTKKTIVYQKESEIFYHSLYYLSGLCSVRELKKCLDTNWNSQYEKFPEYGEWYISQNFIEETLKKYDFEISGEVIKLLSVGDGRVKAGAYVLINLGKNRARRLFNVRELVDQVITPQTVAEEEETVAVDAMSTENTGEQIDVGSLV